MPAESQQQFESQTNTFASPTLPPVFVLSLPDADQRRALIAGQLGRLRIPFEFVDGIYGKNLTPSELEKCYDREKNCANGRPLALPEIGCALGHLEIYRKIVERNLPLAIILEDDAILSPDTEAILERLKTTRLPEENTILLLSHVKYYEAKNILPFDEKRKLVRPYGKREFYGAYGYLITRGAAECLLTKLFPVWNVADAWNDFQKIPNIHFLALLPYCISFSENEKDSQIERERRFSQKEYCAGQKHSIAFFFHKLFFVKFFFRCFIMPLESRTQPRQSDIENGVLSGSKNATLESLRDAASFPHSHTSASLTLPPVFVLSLADAHQRRALIAGQLGRLRVPFEFVDGIYGKNLTPSELEKCYDREKNCANGRPLTLPEIGCALGHLEIYRRMVERNLPFAIILEDDAILSTDAAAIFEKLKATSLPEQNTIVLLSHVKYYEAKNILPFDEKRKLVRPYGKKEFNRTHGYLITRGAAEILLKKLFPVWNVADARNDFQKIPNIHFLALLPYCITFPADEEDSQIEKERRFSLNEYYAGQKRSIAFSLYKLFFLKLFFRYFIVPLKSRKQPDNLPFPKVSSDIQTTPGEETLLCAASGLPSPELSSATKDNDAHGNTLPVIVINLDRSTERLQKIAARLDALGIRWERCPAIDGGNLSPSEILKNYSPKLNRKRYHKDLSAGEIGCYLSFRKAWQIILEKGWDAAVILEDDVIPDDSFPECLATLARNKDKWDALKLGSLKAVKILSQKKLSPAYGNARNWTLVSPLKIPTGTFAQAFSARAARLLLSTTAEFGAPVDVELRNHWRTGVYFQVLLPFPLIHNDGIRSDIESVQSRKSKEFKRRPFSKLRNNILFSLNSYRHKPIFRKTPEDLSKNSHGYPQDEIPIFVINLQRAVERREFMCNQLDSLGLSYRLHPACLGAELTSSELSHAYDDTKREKGLFNRSLSLPEIGCALSHHAIYKQIIQENLPFALILEDDALLDRRLPIILQQLALKINPDEPRAILLTRIASHSRFGSESLNENHELVESYSGRKWVNAHGYFITNRGARTLSDNFFPIRYLADAWAAFEKLSGIRVSALAPFCVTHSHLSSISQIGSTKKQRNHLHGSLNFLWRHVLHRLLIFPLFAKSARKAPFLPVISETDSTAKQGRAEK